MLEDDYYTKKNTHDFLKEIGFTTILEPSNNKLKIVENPIEITKINNKDHKSIYTLKKETLSIYKEKFKKNAEIADNILNKHSLFLGDFFVKKAIKEHYQNNRIDNEQLIEIKKQLKRSQQRYKRITHTENYEEKMLNQIEIERLSKEYLFPKYLVPNQKIFFIKFEVDLNDSKSLLKINEKEDFINSVILEKSKDRNKSIFPFNISYQTNNGNPIKINTTIDNYEEGIFYKHGKNVAVFYDENLKNKYLEKIKEKFDNTYIKNKKKKNKNTAK